MENQKGFKISQYACAVLLIVSSIALVTYQVVEISDVANMTYGCHQLLEPARLIVGPIIINSGFRSEAVNRQVGGVRNSQHLIGQAADIHPKDPAQFPVLVDFFRNWEYTDQLLTASNWLHISWSPFSPPRHIIRIGYYNIM